MGKNQRRRRQRSRSQDCHITGGVRLDHHGLQFLPLTIKDNIFVSMLKKVCTGDNHAAISNHHARALVIELISLVGEDLNYRCSPFRADAKPGTGAGG